MLEKVIEIIKEQLNLEGVEITEDSSFKDDLGADSLAVIDLIMCIEDEFKIEVPDSEVENLKTVGAIVQFIEDHQ